MGKLDGPVVGHSAGALVAREVHDVARTIFLPVRAKFTATQPAHKLIGDQAVLACCDVAEAEIRPCWHVEQ